MLDQLFQKTLGGLFVAPFLHHDIEHVAILINCPPKAEGLSFYLGHKFIKMPLVTGLGSVASDLIGK